MERETAELAGIVDSDIEPGEEFRALLTSDYQCRDRNTGQPDPSWLLNELPDRLGNRAELTHKILGFRRAGGYNRTWGMPLPQTLSLQAGSVVVLRARERIPLADLVSIEQSGIGEGRAEGHGRLMFLEASTAGIHPRSRPKSPPPIPATAPPLILQMQDRLLEEAALLEVQQVAADIAASATNIPSPSLLRRLQMPLRGAISTVQYTGALAELATLFQELRAPARDSLNRCRISLNAPRRTGLRLGLWLRELAGDEADLAELLQLDPLAQRHHITSSDDAAQSLRRMSPQLRGQLAVETLSALARRKNRQEG